jgi:hypothetical protein
MISFPGQISRMGLNSTASLVWQLTPFYIKAYFIVRDRIVGFFVVDVP